MTDNQQAYIIDKVSKFMKRKPDISKNEMEYWNVSDTKMIRSFVVSDKKYVQMLSKDEDITYLSFCEEANLIRFFRCDLSIDYLDKLL